MKSDCYIVYDKNGLVVGVTSTLADADLLKFLAAKEYLKEHGHSYLDYTRDDDVEYYADHCYTINKENFYTKPFRIEEL